MPRYLTAEWFDAARAALHTLDTVSDEMAAAQISIQQIVTGGPDGDVSYHVDLDGGAVRLDLGEAPEPTVTFVQTWDTAAKVARGELSAQGAFMTGLIRVTGDLPRLIEHAPPFGRVDDVLGSLRAATTY